MQKICIIIPCYNEEERFPVEEYSRFLESNLSDITLCFVNDGSTDKTQIVLESVRNRHPGLVRIIHLKHNVGKAEAVRQGINQMLQPNNFTFIGYLDADLATPLTELTKLIEYVSRNKNTSVVFGSRIKRLGTTIERNILRHYLGRIFATVISVIFKISVYDSQCGAKIFKSSICNDLFNTPFQSKWLFDVEILIRIINLYGYKNIHQIVYEFPITSWQEIGGSKIKISDFLKAPFEIIKIRRFYKSGTH